MGEEQRQLTIKPPTLLRNYVSFVGAAIAIAAIASGFLLFLMEVTSTGENPYLGILTYIVFPTFLFFGIFLIAVGMILERRRRRKRAPEDILAYPKLDLNDPRSRKAFFVFLLMTFFFVSASAFGSYKAYEYSDSVAFCGKTCHSVMKPEHIAYQAGAHARVRCVDCHVGPGADWYVRSKLSGAYQLYSVTFKKYPRPITSPVHNLRPAPDTCEQCHWPEKFFGAQLKVFNRYAYDEQNSLRQRRMLINVGGGSPTTGLVQGIHWHMNIANEVDYISTDNQRQVIPWVRMKDRDGNVTEYVSRTRPPTAEQMASGNRRKMDCVDCHNRPAHVYLPPDVATDQGFASGRLDASIPYLKRQAVEVLSRPYQTTDEAMLTIENSLNSFYRSYYPDVYSKKQAEVKSSIAEIKRIFSTYFFPEMKTDWQTHPNNIGHFYFSGCFRCHDGEHVSNTGKVISNNCNICHTMLYDSANSAMSVKTGPFQHPVDLGSLADRKCESCHKANKPFQHPLNLGDISTFQCVQCHRKE
jgi:hypothetical protein